MNFYYTFMGTAFGLLIITLTAYVISRKEFKYRNQVSFLIYFTTIFGGGMIPWYLMYANLLGLGHRDLMHVFGLKNNYDSRQRYAGFRDALKAAGVAMLPECCLDGRLERAAAYREMRRFLSEGHALPQAVFAANDVSAIGCMEALRQFDLRVPEDVSIIGCDDILLCGFVSPNLTTIRTHMHQLGTEAANEVLRLISQGGGRTIHIPGAVIVRHSGMSRSLSACSI